MTDEYPEYEFVLAIVVRQRGRDQGDAINAALDNLRLYANATFSTDAPTPHSAGVGAARITQSPHVIAGYKVPTISSNGCRDE
jgi:hypothetical protein